VEVTWVEGSTLSGSGSRRDEHSSLMVMVGNCRAKNTSKNVQHGARRAPPCWRGFLRPRKARVWELRVGERYTAAS
jgi:hypothetical protein